MYNTHYTLNANSFNTLIQPKYPLNASILLFSMPLQVLSQQQQLVQRHHQMVVHQIQPKVSLKAGILVREIQKASHPIPKTPMGTLPSQQPLQRLV
jgi:hypothetical protein